MFHGTRGCLVYVAVWMRLVLLLSAATVVATAQSGRSAFPGRLETYLTNSVKLTAAERQQLTSGQPVTKLLDGDETKEVAVFGAIWIAAPAGRYVEAMKDIENFERGGGFKVTRRISSPPRPADFAEMRLPDEDIQDMRSCQAGDCILKLSEQAIRRFRNEIDWKTPNVRPAADALMRDILLRYVTGYLEGGNARLAVYRDSSRPTFVANEFREMTDRMPELTTYMPDIRRYLLDYPKHGLTNATSFLYWQETEFGLRPTLRVSHVVIQEAREGTVVASKMLYASHYFWTGLELRVLLPDPSRGTGFWLVTVSRSRSDGLSGFTGFVLRGRVQSGAQDGALAALRATKRALESSR
jgi:hypothetical protein